MKLNTLFLPNGCIPDTKSFFKNGQPDSYTIHWVGAFPGQTPAMVRQWWLDSNKEASAHFIVKDDEVMQCWPTWKTAYHCGNPTGNRTSLAIEVIPKNTKGEFSEKTIRTLAELFFVLPPKPLFRHFDWNGKPCPEYYVDEERWQDLKIEIIQPFWYTPHS